jgi:hypothetical protein
LLAAEVPLLSLWLLLLLPTRPSQAWKEVGDGDEDEDEAADQHQRELYQLSGLTVLGEQGDCEPEDVSLAAFLPLVSLGVVELEGGVEVALVVVASVAVVDEELPFEVEEQAWALAWALGWREEPQTSSSSCFSSSWLLFRYALGYRRTHRPRSRCFVSGDSCRKLQLTHRRPRTHHR